MSTHPVIDLARDLIRRPSVTPDDAGCQTMIADFLHALGFHCEAMRFGEVDNLWAVYGHESPLFVFAGHTDVVPTGPETKWSSPPFAAEVRDGLLFGRGAADMKGSIAAMMIATQKFLEQHPEPAGAIGFLITSDEEGPARDGTKRVMQTLQARGQQIDWCLVGEPSSTEQLGDTIKNGRRGSLGGRLRVLGKQGHIAYPHLASNPIHAALPALTELASIEWDQGNEFFPPTRFQISNIEAGTGAVNVIPGELEVLFNLRFSTAITAEAIRTRIEQCLDRHGLDCELDWNLSGHPFLTQPGELTAACQAAVREQTGREARLSTSGGTSDGRFIAPSGAQVVELGPLNATIHQIDEHLAVADLDLLSRLYYSILCKLLLKNEA